MNIGINGHMAGVTQTYAELRYAQPLGVITNVMTFSADYMVVSRELGVEDQFFLNFDEIAGVVSKQSQCSMDRVWTKRKD